MSADAHIITQVQAAFDSVERPEHFTHYLHCEECEEHNTLLNAHDRHTLNIDDIDNPGWDPIGFCNPQGKAYYLPTLVRFALQDTPQGESYLLVQLLHHLESGGPNSALITYCSTNQRAAIAAFLEYVIETRTASIERFDVTDRLLRAHHYWTTAEPGVTG